MKNIKLTGIVFVVVAAVFAGVAYKWHSDKEHFRGDINKTSTCSQDSVYDSIYQLNKNKTDRSSESSSTMELLIDIAKSCSVQSVNKNIMLNIFNKAFSSLTEEQRVNVLKQAPEMQPDFLVAILKSKNNNISDSKIPYLFSEISTSARYKEAIVSLYKPKLPGLNKSYIEIISRNLIKIQKIDGGLKDSIVAIKDALSNYIVVNNFLEKNYRKKYGAISDGTLRDISKLENIYESIWVKELNEYLVTTTFKYSSPDGGYDYNAILNGSMPVLLHTTEGNEIPVRSTMRLMLNYIGSEEVSALNGDSKQIWDKYEVVPESKIKEYNVIVMDVTVNVNKMIDQ